MDKMGMMPLNSCQISKDDILFGTDQKGNNAT